LVSRRTSLQSNFRDPEPDPFAYQPYRADASDFAILMVRTMATGGGDGIIR